MNISDLYNRLDKIFVEHTTHNWKNGWQHEGDRGSKELTIQKHKPWNNLFLLQEINKYIYGKSILLDGPQGFRIEVNPQNDHLIRIDIEAKGESKYLPGIDIYYFIDNELDWLSTCDFIVDLCQSVYDTHVKVRETISVIPDDLHGDKNPSFTRPFRREIQLKELGI